MKARGNNWSIVLAAGDGTRLRSLTTDRKGTITPKQFCSLPGAGSLLSLAVARAKSLAGPGHAVAVVAAGHERWWRRELADLPHDNIIVQPSNRGTAPGILLPLLEVLTRDAEALVTILPSDHYVRNERALERAARRAIGTVKRRQAEVVLLGVTPDAAVPDYGWILPQPGKGRGAIRRVARFVEKPPVAEAERLMRGGGLWNSFLLVARASSLLELFMRRLPWITLALGDAAAVPPPHRATAVSSLYMALAPADFSRDVLQGSEDRLTLLSVPACGWTDLGTPERVAACLAAMERPAAGAASFGSVMPAGGGVRVGGMMVLSLE